MRTAACLVTLMLAAPAIGNATLVTALPLEELAAQSDLVVYGEVVSTEPFVADDGRIYTRVALQPMDGSDPVRILQLGGRLDDLVTRVPGADLYETGETVFVFLEYLQEDTYQSLSLSFSKFSVDPQGELAHRVVDAAALAAPPLGPPLPPAALAWFPEQVPLAELARVAPMAPRVVGLPLPTR